MSDVSEQLKRQAEQILGIPVDLDDPAERYFVEAVYVDGPDGCAWSVFADWLDERGDDRGELVRVERELRRMGWYNVVKVGTMPTAEFRRGDQLFLRRRELRERLGVRWVLFVGGPWDDRVGEVDVRRNKSIFVHAARYDLRRFRVRDVVAWTGVVANSPVPDGKHVERALFRHGLIVRVDCEICRRQGRVGTRQPRRCPGCSGTGYRLAPG